VRGVCYEKNNARKNQYAKNAARLIKITGNPHMESGRYAIAFLGFFGI
jgi:hypothetical protein